MQVESHRDMIKPRKKLLDLGYSNVSRPHTTGLYEAKYYVILLCNATKQSKTILLKEKNGVFSAFKRYCSRNEKSDKRVQRLQMDGGNEFDSKEFAKF